MGQGIITIQTVTWNDLGKPTIVEEWQKALQLPENFRVMEVRFDPALLDFGCDAYRLLVETDIILIDELCRIIPYYHKERGKDVLDRIEIDWDGASRPMIFIPELRHTKDIDASWLISLISDAMKEAQKLADQINRGTAGREVSLCITKLEEARHRAVDAHCLLGDAEHVLNAAWGNKQ